MVLCPTIAKIQTTNISWKTNKEVKYRVHMFSSFFSNTKQSWLIEMFFTSSNNQKQTFFFVSEVNLLKCYEHNSSIQKRTPNKIKKCFFFNQKQFFKKEKLLNCFWRSTSYQINPCVFFPILSRVKMTQHLAYVVRWHWQWHGHMLMCHALHQQKLTEGGWRDQIDIRDTPKIFKIILIQG